MAAHFVAAKVAGSTTAKSAHQTAVTLGLCVGVGGAVLLLAWLAIGVLALGVLIVGVGALLGKLLLRLWAGILALLLAVLSLGMLVMSPSQVGEKLTYACCCWS